MTFVDIVADLTAKDEAGYVVTPLAEALDPDLIEPGARVVAGDEDDSAIAIVVDLVPGPKGKLVRLDVQ